MNQVRLGNFAQAERMWLDQIAVLKAMGNLTGAAGLIAQVCEKIYFIQGRFSLARSAAEEALQIGTLVDDTPAIGFSLITLGLIAGINEDYGECQRLCEEVRSAYAKRFTEYTNIAAWGFALAACGQGNVTAAQEHLAVASSYLFEILGDVGIIAALPIAAVILAHHEHPVRAVELLALAHNHPLDAAGWIKKWPLVNRVCIELENVLGPAAYADAWERGTQSDLQAAMVDLKKLVNEDAAPTTSANQTLVEPLTPRELEILQLVAEGHTNAQIADLLVVSAGTVRWHLYNLCGKLTANNRTQAVMRARELEILQ